MERHFGLPIAFAAAAHAALLFGFSKPPAVSPPKEKRVVIEWPLPPPPDDPEPLVAETKRTEPLERLDIAPPRQPEPAPIDVTTKFTQPVPPMPPFDPANVEMRVAPTALTGQGEIGARLGGVVPSGLLDNPPRTRYQSSPLYPMEAKKDGRGGEVVVEFTVDESGRVIDPRVVSSTDRVFEESSLRAVARWQFEPGRREGKIVRFRMNVPLVFKLNE